MQDAGVNCVTGVLALSFDTRRPRRQMHFSRSLSTLMNRRQAPSCSVTVWAESPGIIQMLYRSVERCKLNVTRKWTLKIFPKYRFKYFYFYIYNIFRSYYLCLEILYNLFHFFPRILIEIFPHLSFRIIGQKF